MTDKERLEELQYKEFMLQMKDHWSREDYDLDSKYNEEIRELKEKLNGSNS